MAVLESAARIINFHSLLKPWIPASTAVRWRTRKPNVQRPIPDHYVKARYKAALEPLYPDEITGKPWYTVCGNLVSKKEEAQEYKYEKLLAQQFYGRFADSQIIAVFHQNCENAREQMKINQMLHGYNMKMVFGSKKIATMALVGTEFESVLRLHIGRTCYMCCKDLQVSKMLKFTKKMKNYVLLGGIVQRRLLTKNQLIWCATLPDIDTLRAELCSILNSSASQISQALVHHQQTLTQALHQHYESSEKEKI